MLALAADAGQDCRLPIWIASESSKVLKTFDEILSCQSLRSLEPHQHLFHQGDNERFAGDILGFQAAAERHCGAEAVTAVKLRSLDENSAYRQLRDEPALAPQLIGLLSRELENARGQIAVLNRRSAIEKLAAFILELHRKQGETGTVEILLSRTDIADFLGLTIETVSRNLTKLRTRRIIDLPQVQRLVIVDLACLEALAGGECEDW